MTTPKTRTLRYISLGVLIALGIALFATFRPATHETVVQDDGEPPQFTPVVYDTQNWTMSKPAPNDYTAAKSVLGANAVQESALDFAGNLAQKYRYNAASEPPLYVIESDSLFELVWYFAAATDQDHDKNASITAAKKAYQAASILLGERGAALVAQMLDGKPSQGAIIQGTAVQSATCENYTCRLVIEK
ncbi:Uncharacterised protein [Moraxella caviae]|nr:Uncharacterised protein [Moraxella caviae]